MNTVITEPTESDNEVTEQCPFHTPDKPQAALDIDDELILLNHKRVVSQYSTTDSGATELYLYYGEKEISFDEPALFAFGEALAKQARFVAREATTWGEGYDWSVVQPLLEQLIEEGILQDATSIVSVSEHNRSGVCSSPLPPAPCSVPRTWHECEAITRELTGRPLELGYLELVIPIYRVAHIALDAEERQVGEANVFPTQLRLDVPTDWRTCLHAGSRYQDEQPMNVTSLKSIRQHWSQTMAALLRVREAYLRRFPEARQGWTLGHLQRLSALVLTLPAYLLMRSERRVDNGQLHPVLSSMFRITDGVRMTVHSMLFMPDLEPTLSPTAPISSAELYAYVERNNLFHSDHGVCAGPKAMIEEFLRTLVDGQLTEGVVAVVLDAPVDAALADIESAFDYGLFGLQAHAVVHSLWPIMTRTYEQLWSIIETWSGKKTAIFRDFQERLQRSVRLLQTESLFATEAWRVNREQAYTDMYAQSARGLGATPASGTLAHHITPRQLTHHTLAEDQLHTVLQQRFSNANADVERLVTTLLNYLCREQAIVQLACEIQSHINSLLGRTLPKRPFTASDINLFYRLQDRDARLPYLADELSEALGLRIAVTKDSIGIFDRTVVSSNTIRG